MDTEKVLGNAAKKTWRATSEFVKDQRQQAKERNERARQARAERAAYNARMSAVARESYSEVMDLIQAHNDAYRTWCPIRLATDPVPVTKCSMSTSFWDCEDPNCWYHSDEKKDRGIGTPTRKFHPDFQKAEAPKDPITQLFGTLLTD